jgi:hypothetical protein
VNQAVSFGLVAVGGALVVSVFSGRSLAQTVKGEGPFTVSGVGSHLTTGGVSGVGASIAGPGGAISSPAGLTVKGSAASAANVQAANVILSVAHGLGVSADAATSMIYAAIYESGLTQGGSRNSLGYGGVLAGGSSFATSDSAGMAKAFLLGDAARGYQGGGAVHLLSSGASIPQAAVQTEVPSIWPHNAYAAEAGYGSDQRAIDEARAWVNAYGGFA